MHADPARTFPSYWHKIRTLEQETASEQRGVVDKHEEISDVGRATPTEKHAGHATRWAGLCPATPSITLASLSGVFAPSTAAATAAYPG